MRAIRNADSSKGDNGTMYESVVLLVKIRDRRATEHVAVDGVAGVGACPS